MAVINAEHAAAMAHARIEPGPESFGWTWADEAALESPLWPVARDAADLLTHPDAVRVKACASDDCSALFVDTTKNRRRRWCDMKICGNRAKVRRHRESKRRG